MPKVSVIVPIYNVEKYLRECLDSLINQTLTDIEFVCINDGATDNSLDILKEYAQNDDRIKIVDKKNTGYGNSMNLGIELATGEYIGIVEPDDFAKNTMFFDLYELAKKNDADIVKSEYYDYTTTNNKKQARKTALFSKFKVFHPFALKDIASLIRKPPSIWSAIYRKTFLTENNIKFMDTPGAGYQDTSFSFKALCLAKRIVLTSNAYISYRSDNANSSVNSKDKVLTICGEYEEIDRFLNENPEIKEYINTEKLIKQYVTYMWNLKRLNNNSLSEFADKFSETYVNYYKNGEITKDFYKKVNEKEFLQLINEKDAFKKNIVKKLEDKRKKDKRRKMFSIRINRSRISVVLFGKQIVEIG